MVGIYPTGKTKVCRRTCRVCSKDGYAEVSRELFLKSFCFFCNVSAEKLSVQPAVSLGIGPSEAAAVCSEPS